MRWLPSLLALACLLVFLTGCMQGESPAEETTTPVDFGELELEATATTGLIRGVVVDAAIRPVGNATVTLTPGDKTTASTAAGTFGFDALEPGTYFLKVEKSGYNSTQTSTEVVAGLAEPPIVKVLITANPSIAPYYEVFSYDAFITCGVAVVVTSVGCSTFSDVGEALGDNVYFTFEFTSLPWWTQGELVWEQTQSGGGAMIWEIVDPNYPGTPQRHTGYRETGTSPALAYINTTTLKENEEWVVGEEGEGHGVRYRIFAGPHPACTPAGFGCGLTLQQRMTGYIHHFYNFAPVEGWRFTVDGDPEVPQ